MGENDTRKKMTRVTFLVSCHRSQKTRISSVEKLLCHVVTKTIQHKKCNNVVMKTERLESCGDSTPAYYILYFFSLELALKQLTAGTEKELFFSFLLMHCSIGHFVLTKSVGVLVTSWEHTGSL